MEVLCPNNNSIKTVLFSILLFLGITEPAFKILVAFMTVNIVFAIITLLLKKSKEKVSLVFVQKLLIFINIGVASSIDLLTGTHELRNLTIYFFLAKEGLGILNYSSKLGVEYPAAIRHILEQFSRPEQEEEQGDRSNEFSELKQVKQGDRSNDSDASEQGDRSNESNDIE